MYSRIWNFANVSQIVNRICSARKCFWLNLNPRDAYFSYEWSRNGERNARIFSRNETIVLDCVWCILCICCLNHSKTEVEWELAIEWVKRQEQGTIKVFMKCAICLKFVCKCEDIWINCNTSSQHHRTRYTSGSSDPNCEIWHHFTIRVDWIEWTCYCGAQFKKPKVPKEFRIVRYPVSLFEYN